MCRTNVLDENQFFFKATIEIKKKKYDEFLVLKATPEPHSGKFDFLIINHVRNFFLSSWNS